MDQGPIFLAGAERSGTSLLYALLTSHPNIAMTRRTNLWTYFYNRYGDLSKPENLDRCLAMMMRYKRLVVLQHDFNRLRSEFLQGEPTYGRLFWLLGKQHAERTGKPRWGDKSLNAERYADDIFTTYPSAKIIHMIRDPRDRYASARTRWKKMKGKVGVGTALWLASVRLAKRNQLHYPKGYKVIRYESLVTQPEKTLREVCTFLGEEYSPAMLAMGGAENFRDDGGNSSYGQREPGRISTDSIRRYLQVMSNLEIAFMQMYAKHDMQDFGYLKEPVRFSNRDRLMFIFHTWPANYARMMIWRALESVRDIRGRTVPHYRIVPEAKAVKMNV